MAIASAARAARTCWRSLQALRPGASMAMRRATAVRVEGPPSRLRRASDVHPGTHASVVAERAGEVVARRLVVVLGGERGAELVPQQVVAHEEGVDAGERAADQTVA